MCRDFVPRHPVAVVRFAVVLNGLGAVLGILGTFSIRFPARRVAGKALDTLWSRHRVSRAVGAERYHFNLAEVLPLPWLDKLESIH